MPVSASYFTWLRVERGLSANTVMAYRRELAQLPDPVEHLQTSQLREALYAREGAPATIGRRLAAWRSYYRWLVFTEQRQDDPTLRLSRPKVRRGLPHPVSDLHAKLRDADPETRAIATLLVETGLRISELLAVAVPSPPPPELLVLGKGGKERIVPLSPEAQAALEELGGRVRLSARSIQERFRRLGFHPHALRHTFASDLIRTGADIGDAQKLLGHSSVATTQIYAAFDQERLRAANERRRAARREGEA